MKPCYYWMMYVASEWMEAWKDYKEACKKRVNTSEEWDEACKHIDYTSANQDKKSEALWTAFVVTRIPQEVMIAAARVERKYMERTGYQKCLFMDGDNPREEEKRERLFNSLMSRSPESLEGIYQNEFFDGAVRRIEERNWYRDYNRRQRTRDRAYAEAMEDYD